MATAAVRAELSEIESSVRPCVRGKFIFVGANKFFIKGVTYGAFRPNDAGMEYHDLYKIRRDFGMMVRHGINTVRIPHTTPPVHVLDIAAEYGLRVIVGLSAEQYIGYLIDGQKSERALPDILSKVRSVKRHPALLCYALGNEIPAALARWLGRERIESYLRDLYQAVKAEDPDTLVTYVNYPSTEYLQLPFLDFCCFNVYLEQQDKLEAYVARLQNIAVDRPLVMTELGLDAQRNGEARQADVLDWQIRTTFEGGCAGAVVFSWTDEWYRGGGDVDDWEFGLTSCERSPKPALFSVQRAFAESPFPMQDDAPSISVVVCTYNGSRTIGECLHHLSSLNYPNYEVIVVDDGSTDRTSEIAQGYNVRLIRTENRGLSAARNTGREHSRGEIVAYIDDDAYPDSDWLNYYGRAFQRTSHAMIGGPNLPPTGDPSVAQCVARAPGGPTHILLTDTIAEHVPGCNMVFRKSCLEEIGGFDPIFRTAGDDVDVCWRIQDKGWTVGFAPSAVVWHHRRSSVWAYWRQQRGYGRAEALLQQKWPGRFNASNHLPWAGRIYRAGVSPLPEGRSFVHHGVWGQAPFQGLYGGAATFWEHLLETPELHLLNAALAILSALGLVWPPMLAFLPFLCVGLGYPMFRAAVKARQAQFPDSLGHHQLGLKALTGVLHVLQPLARLKGRLQHGLTPWKRRGSASAVLPYRREWKLWTETWIDPHERLCALERAFITSGHTVRRGNAYEAWDLEIVGGLLGSARTLMAVEDHGSGRQYIRLAAWPRYSRLGLSLGLGGILIALAAAGNGEFGVAAMLGIGSVLLLGGTLLEAGRSLATVMSAPLDREKISPLNESCVGVFGPVLPHRMTKSALQDQDTVHGR